MSGVARRVLTGRCVNLFQDATTAWKTGECPRLCCPLDAPACRGNNPRMLPSPARAHDVLRLIPEIRHAVSRRAGILMQWEVRYVSSGDSAVPAH